VVDNKKYISLRTLFIRWIVLFSLLPLVLVVILLAQQFKTAVQDEIFERLIVYTKQVQDLFDEYESFSRARLNELAEDKGILYLLKTSSVEELKTELKRRLEEEVPSAYAVYNEDGTLLLRVGSREFANIGPAAVDEKLLERLNSAETATHAYYFSNNAQVHLQLSVVKKIQDEKLNWTGYVEKSIILENEITNSLKSQQGMDIVFFGPKGDIFVTSLPEERFTREQLSKDFLRGNNHFFDISLQGQSFGFISTAVSWGEQSFLIAIGASKTALTKSFSRVMYLLLIAFAFLILCLLIFSYFFTHQIIQPLTRLVEAIQKMKTYSEPIQVEIKSKTEIGLLSESFNEMSRTIYGYRSDLETKILDLEKANTEVQATQTQLIQSAKLAGLGQLVAGVAHELNNPIGFVYSNMQHLREYTNSLLGMIQELSKKNENFEKIKKKYDYEFISKDLPKLISSCEEGARRTRDIVTGLRTFSRSSDKDQKKFSVTDCIDSTLDLLRGAIKNDKITIQKSYDDFVPLIVGNPNQVSQVFMNVISNAFQAIPSKQGQVSIQVQYLKDDQMVSIKIADSGVGISKGDIDKIFDPFYTTKDVGQGTGLGLSISYGIVKSHGGEIKVESEVGRGTQFEILFPALEDETPNR
jgi:two-component system, NtrC family, sensor kinase